MVRDGAALLASRTFRLVGVGCSAWAAAAVDIDCAHRGIEVHAIDEPDGARFAEARDTEDMQTTVRTLRKGAAAALLSLGLLLSACGGSDSPGSGRAQGVAGVPDGSAFVDQHSLKFNPKALAVSASEPVFFKNSDTTVHTVSVNGKNESGTMKAGDVFRWKAPGAGEYKISCEFHPQMKATVTVGP